MPAKSVIVYSTNSCPWCHRVKQWLDERHVKYEEVNLNEDPSRIQEMVDKSGQMGVPVVDVSGQIIIGFDEEKLKTALSIKG